MIKNIRFFNPFKKRMVGFIRFEELVLIINVNRDKANANVSNIMPYSCTKRLVFCSSASQVVFQNVILDD